jgi:serine/threonine protein kinase
MTQAMKYLHSFNPPLVHRDLKSLNILLASTNAQDEVIAKVTDFGTALQFSSATGRVVDCRLYSISIFLNLFSLLVGSRSNEKGRVYLQSRW